MSQQLPLPFGLDPEFTFERFLSGPNAQAVMLMEAAAKGAAPMPLFVHGPSASGKTHLLQACCIAAGQTGRQAMSLPLSMIRQQGPHAIEGLETFDCVCLDDLESVAGEIEWEMGLFRLFNAIKDRGAQLVVAAKSPPRQLPLVLEDLRSRLASGPVVALRPLSELESIQALMAHASAIGLELSEPVAHYLVRRVHRDLGSLLRHLDQLDRASMAASRKLTIPFVRSIIDTNNR